MGLDRNALVDSLRNRIQNECSDKLGLSLELGSFVAGVMISTTDLAQHTLEQVEPTHNFLAALFLASIGMLIRVHFLWNHVDTLLASVLLVIIVKIIVITVVVKGFGYNYKTSLLVGMSLAQIGEFAFVLLSRAFNLHLVEALLENNPSIAQATDDNFGQPPKGSEVSRSSNGEDDDEWS